MRVDVEWKGGLRFDGTGESGHTVTMDASREASGEDSGPRPTEILLFGVGGCTGIDVALLLKKMRQDVTGLSLRITGERANQDPKRFVSVHIRYIVKGRGLDEAKVKRAVQLSEEKYCTVSNSLNAEVTTSYELVEE